MRRALLIIAVVILGVAAVLIGFNLGGGAPPLAASPTATPSPTPVSLDQALLGRRVTFLVLGTDQNAQRQAAGSGVLTDSMVVVSVNAAHSQVTMISVPRDTVDVPLSDGTIWRSKLNGLYESRGGQALRQAFEQLLGAPVDYTILVNMDDFVKIVDAFGGVDVNVTEAIQDPTVGLNITAGPHHLDGAHALAFSRSRHTTNDFSRAARQQQVLVALLKRFDDPATTLDALALLSSLQSLKTDIPNNKLPTIIEIARRSRAAAVTNTVLQPPRFFQVSTDTVRGYILLPRLSAIQAFAKPLLTAP